MASGPASSDERAHNRARPEPITALSTDERWQAILTTITARRRRTRIANVALRSPDPNAMMHCSSLWRTFLAPLLPSFPSVRLRTRSGKEQTESPQ